MESLVSMISNLKKVYEGKKVFVSGHTGFKGAWLLKTLSLLGANVKGYALPPQYENDLFNLIKGDCLCHSVFGDLRNREHLKSEILDFQPDFIFHLAAQPLVRLSYEMPVDTFEINATGTANLLDAIRYLETKCCAVMVTTDKVYRNNEWEYPYRENDILGGYDPYSASKACCELIIDSYRNSFFNIQKYDQHQKAIAVGRAGNVIGGGDWSKDRLIPDIAKAFGSKESVVIRNPSSIRPWQHVLEPVVGYLILGARLSEDPVRFSKPFNFGPYPGDALPVSEMVSLAIEYWPDNKFEVSKEERQPHEAGLLILDINRSLKELKWRPAMNARQAIENTINWYRQFYQSPSCIEEITNKQILDFLSNEVYE